MTTRWIDTQQAAAELGMDVSVLRRIVNKSKNPPPFVRPAERTMLFDMDALHEWQKTWIGGEAKRGISAPTIKIKE